jgi:hypothetical protein
MPSWQFEYPCSGLLVEQRNAVGLANLLFVAWLTLFGRYELAYKADIEWVVFTCEQTISKYQLPITNQLICNRWLFKWQSSSLCCMVRNLYVVRHD